MTHLPFPALVTISSNLTVVTATIKHLVDQQQVSR